MAVMTVRSYTPPATLKRTACYFIDPSRCAKVGKVTDAASAERVHAEERLRGRCHACTSSLQPSEVLNGVEDIMAYMSVPGALLWRPPGSQCCRRVGCQVRT